MPKVLNQSFTRMMEEFRKEELSKRIRDGIRKAKLKKSQKK